jgi:hypothetical protein
MSQVIAYGQEAYAEACALKLSHNQLGIVRLAMRQCHWFCCAGASRQRGNLNLNKRVIRESSV